VRDARRNARAPLAGAAVALAAAGLLAGCTAPTDVTANVTSVDIVEHVEGQSWIEARGIVHGIAERGGVCRFTFWAENGAASRLTSTGRIEGGATVCGPVSEQVGRTVVPGRYEVELRYDSTSTSARSERVEVDVPAPPAAP